MNLEIWKPIRGFIGYYEISDKARIRSIKRNIITKDGNSRQIKEKLLKTSVNADGYLEVMLSKNAENECHYIHRLVAEAFIPNPRNLPEVNHLKSKLDNTPADLEWVSHQDNCIHAYKTGLNKHKGGSHFNAVGVIDNYLGQSFDTIKEWSAARGVNYSTVKGIMSGHRTSKTINLSEIVLLKKSNKKNNGKY